MCLPCGSGEGEELTNRVVLMVPEKLRIEPGTSPIRNAARRGWESAILNIFKKSKKTGSCLLFFSDMVAALERSCQRNKENDIRSQIPGVRTIAWFFFI